MSRAAAASKSFAVGTGAGAAAPGASIAGIAPTTLIAAQIRHRRRHTIIRSARQKGVDLLNAGKRTPRTANRAAQFSCDWQP
jgi:hypothetical protein